MMHLCKKIQRWKTALWTDPNPYSILFNYCGEKVSIYTLKSLKKIEKCARIPAN